MALRYEIPFKSKNGTSCYINVYDSTFSGSSTTLSPSVSGTPGMAAPNPITIEEDNSENLLSVIRAKTGYLNLIETSHGSLRSLFPETNTQLRVEAYYGSDMIFYGYIQAQSYEISSVPGPRLIQLPIFSPLAALSNKFFQADTLFADRPIGEYLDECLSVYDYVILPLYLLDDSESGIGTPLQLEINPRVVSPFNKEYDYGIEFDGDTPSTFTPISYSEFIEGVCNLFGLIAHECGKTVIFSKFDYESQYVKIQVGDLSTNDYSTSGMPTGSTGLSFEDYFSPCGTGTTEGAVMPIGELTYEYGDANDDVPMDLSRSKYVGRTNMSAYNMGTMAVLSHQTNELVSSLLTTSITPSGNYVRIIGNGKEEMVQYNCLISAGSSRDVEIFSYTFSNVPPSVFGATFETTHSHAAGAQNYQMRMQVLSGGKYYDENHDWVSSPQFLPLVFDEQGKCETFDVAANGHSVTIKLFPPSSSSVDPTGGIFKKITLNVLTIDPIKKYEIPDANRKVIRGSDPSKSSATITFLINSATNNPNRVIKGHVPREPYTYLFNTMARMEWQVMKSATISNEELYLRRITTTAQEGGWRIIAVSFYPWNDEYQITMQGSSIL